MEREDSVTNDVIELGAVSTETKGVGLPNDDVSGIGRKQAGITEE